MPGIARQGDAIVSKSASNHCTRPATDSQGNPYTENYTCTISGVISNSGANTKVYIDGKLIATVGSSTYENDDNHTNSLGSIISGSSKVFINGQPVARIGDNVTLHNGDSTTISQGSSRMIVST